MQRYVASQRVQLSHDLQCGPDAAQGFGVFRMLADTMLNVHLLAVLELLCKLLDQLCKLALDAWTGAGVIQVVNHDYTPEMSASCFCKRNRARTCRFLTASSEIPITLAISAVDSSSK